MMTRPGDPARSGLLVALGVRGYRRRASCLSYEEIRMTIEQWNPFNEMVSLRDAVNSLLHESLVPPGGARSEGRAATFTLPLNITEEEDFVVTASMPAMKSEDVRTMVL